MNVDRRDERCPNCGSAELEQQARMEADDASSEDVIVYRCRQCQHSWDTSMPLNLPAERCGARTIFWPDVEACEAECIRHQGHKGTIHEDEILGDWDEEDMITWNPSEA